MLLYTDFRLTDFCVEPFGWRRRVAVFPYSAPDGVTHLLRERGSVPFLVTNTPSTHTSTHKHTDAYTLSCIGVFAVLLFLWWFCLLKIKTSVNKWVLTVKVSACYCSISFFQFRNLQSNTHYHFLLLCR